MTKLKKSEMPFICTTTQLTKLFDVTKKSIAEWIKKGMPQISRGKFMVRDVVLWWLDNIMAEKASEEEASARDRYWLAKAEGEEIKVSNLKKELASISEFEQQEAYRAAGLRGSLRGLTSRLVSALEMKSREEIRPILSREIDAILETFYLNRSYGEPPKKKAVKKATKKKVKK